MMKSKAHLRFQEVLIILQSTIGQWRRYYRNVLFYFVTGNTCQAEGFYTFKKEALRVHF